MGFHIFNIIDYKLLKQHCIICGNVIANEVIKLSKLKWRYHKKHKNLSSKPKNYLKERLLKSLQKQIFTVLHINTNALWASYKIALWVAKTETNE